MEIRNRSRILCLIQAYDGIISVWLRLWWVVVFVDYLSQNTLSIREMVCSITGLATAFAIAKRTRAPKLGEVWLFAILGYASLLALAISCDAFILIGAVVCAWGSALASGFATRLVACNIPNKDDRTRHDNWLRVTECLAGLAGAGLFWAYDLKDAAPWTVWVAIYVLFDIDLLVTTILIQKGQLAYDHRYDVSS